MDAPTAPVTAAKTPFDGTLDWLSKQELRGLRFPEPLETEFRRDHRRGVRQTIRMGLVVALFTTLGFAIIDHSALQGISRVSDYVRFGLQLPMIVMCLIATSTRFYSRWYEMAVVIGAAMFGTGTVIMTANAVPEHAPLVGSRLLLVTFFVYFLVGLRMREAMLANLWVLTALALANLIDTFAPAVAAYQLFALVCANVIGAAGAYALEHANRLAFLERKQLAHVAEHDGLTGLFNRHAFESLLRDAWATAAVRGTRVTVIMIDIDHFKAYNDLLGHQAGDNCLRRVADAVGCAVGEGRDRFVARYGGEELVAVIAGASDADALRAAQDIVAAVSSLGIGHPGADPPGRVTVSVGAASQIPGPQNSHDFVVKIADRALYTAKRQGRNRCVAVTVPEPGDDHAAATGCSR
ncbi:MAG: diguanylate cyclase [Steroidobacteraceae bacterium]